MVGASPKSSSFKLWASGVPLVSVLVESLQTRFKKRVLGSDPQRDSHLKEIQLEGPDYRMRTKALQHRLMHVRSHVFPIRHGHRCC